MAATRITGHVLVNRGKRGPVFYSKIRLADGRQVMRRIGPQWTERSRPPAGYFTKKTAEEVLQATLSDARRGTLPDSRARSGHTLGEGCDEWLRYVEHDRQRRPSTLADYGHIVRGCLLREFGATTPIE